MNKTVLFTNWSNEDFTYTYASEPYDFPVGKSVYLPDYLALHFAKHLANRELQRIGGVYDTYASSYKSPVFQEFFNRSLSEPLPVTSEIKAEVDVANRDVSSELEPKKKSKIKKPATEEEFAGLKE